MGKNVAPPVKATILLFFLLTIFSLTALDSGDRLKGFDLENPATVMMLKLTQAVSALIIFIIPAIVFVLFTSEKKLGYLKLNGFNFILGVAALVLVFAAMPVINWMGELNNHLSLPEFLSGVENWMKTKEENLKKLTKIFLEMNSVGDLIINLIIVALLAAVGEELLFRGALQNTLAEWFKNTHLSVWVTAILFSALHAQFYGFIPRMLLGVVLGYLYVWSGSLWLPILFHFLNNGLAVLFSYLIGKGIISDAAETVGAGDTPIMFVIASAMVSVGLMYFIYIKHPTPSELLS
ncbi:MAG: CPBP family intramembrane metalloprotease [Bacteroidetes bacterium]|nr:MAG: CPBP family intramembrane metalloprotease [Bacteroidota bacterium]